MRKVRAAEAAVVARDSNSDLNCFCRGFFLGFCFRMVVEAAVSELIEVGFWRLLAPTTMAVGLLLLV